MTACTALEVACQEATGTPSIGRRFKEDLDQVIAKLGKERLDWGSSVWQEVTNLRDLRKGYVHRITNEKDLFPPAFVADEAISTARHAIQDVYRHVGKEIPLWVDDDDDRGWHVRSYSSANVTGLHNGADPNGPDSIRICYVKDGTEFTADVYPSGTEWQEKLDELAKRMNVPISEVRAYCGVDLLGSQPVHMRGN